MLTRDDRKLFIALVAWALLPSMYLLVRMNIVAVNGVDINILGQMEWFDLIMFGWGMVAHLLLSAGLYVFVQKSMVKTDREIDL